MTVEANSELVERLRSGDREAVKETYEQYHGGILSLAEAMLGRRDGAWDVLQDVFISFGRNARGLAPDTDLRKYLLTAAANRCRDALSRHRAVSLDCGPANYSLSEAIAGAESDPVTIASDKEEAAKLWEALISLDDEQRGVIAMHIYGDMTFREISAREGISENTAQSRYRYALQNIRRKLREVKK